MIHDRRFERSTPAIEAPALLYANSGWVFGGNKSWTPSRSPYFARLFTPFSTRCSPPWASPGEKLPPRGLFSVLFRPHFGHVHPPRVLHRHPAVRRASLERANSDNCTFFRFNPPATRISHISSGRFPPSAFISFPAPWSFSVLGNSKLSRLVIPNVPPRNIRANI